MTNDPEQTWQGKPSGDSNKRQDNPLWLQMWRDDRIEEFHQSVVNPLLTRHWHSQNLKKNSRILVPLCGKSLDMLWLAEQGYSVVGIELSPIAVKAFFSENHLKVKKSRKGNFTCWKSGAIAIWCGDFFSLQKNHLGRIDSVLDRAALTALPENIREQYVAQLRALIDDDVGIFLLTVEDVAKDSGLQSNRIDSELTRLYREHFEIELMYVQRLDAVQLNEVQLNEVQLNEVQLDAVQGGSPKQGYYIDSKVYQMSRYPADADNHATTLAAQSSAHPAK